MLSLLMTRSINLGAREALVKKCTTRLAMAFIRTSYTISRGSITLREFPLVRVRKSLAFACENNNDTGRHVFVEACLVRPSLDCFYAKIAG